MGSCVLKECGFQLNKRQIIKEKTFKEHMKSDYFFRMAEDFDPAKQKISKLEINNLNSEDEGISQVNTKGPSSKEKLEKFDKFESPKFISPTILAKRKDENGFKKDENNSSPAFEKKEIKSALKNKIKKEEAIEDLRKSGTSSDYRNGFNNKLFFNEKLSSYEENNNEFEQIFKDEGDSDDEAFIEKMFPTSSFKKGQISS